MDGLFFVLCLWYAIVNHSDSKYYAVPINSGMLIELFENKTFTLTTRGPQGLVMLKRTRPDNEYNLLVGNPMNLVEFY